MARALGTDDAVNNCDCCGRTGLKFTVVIELDDGEIVHYGQVCAGRNTGKARAVIDKEIRDEAARVLELARADYRAAPARLAYEARLRERDEYARRTGARMLGRAAMEFVADAAEADDAARAAIAAKYKLAPYAIHL